MQELKRTLFNISQNYTQERIKTADSALADNRASLEDDSKSSAGDKYETSREMIQQEVVRNELLLADARQMEVVLSKINIDQTYETIQNGSLAITNNGSFFFSIAGGKFQVDKKDYFIISINSPLGQLFKDKKAGEAIVFNGKKYSIKEVY